MADQVGHQKGLGAEIAAPRVGHPHRDRDGKSGQVGARVRGQRQPCSREGGKRAGDKDAATSPEAAQANAPTTLPPMPPQPRCRMRDRPRIPAPIVALFHTRWRHSSQQCRGERSALLCTQRWATT